MRCSDVTERLALYAGDDLDRRTASRVAEHLRGCASCAAEAGAYRESTEFLRESSEPAFGAEFFDGIRRDVLAEIQRSPAPARAARPAWVMPVAASLAVAALSFAVAASSGILTSPAGAPPDTSSVVQPPAPPARVDTPPEVVRGDRGPERGTPPVKRVHHVTPRPRRDVASENVAASRPVSTDDMLRIEYQTSDPNIRIIWFVPKEGSGANEPTKTGI